MSAALPDWPEGGDEWRVRGYGRLEIDPTQSTEVFVTIHLATTHPTGSPEKRRAVIKRNIGALLEFPPGSLHRDGKVAGDGASRKWRPAEIEVNPKKAELLFRRLDKNRLATGLHKVRSDSDGCSYLHFPANGHFYLIPSLLVAACYSGHSDEVLRHLVFPVRQNAVEDLLEIIPAPNGSERLIRPLAGIGIGEALQLLALHDFEAETRYQHIAATSWRRNLRAPRNGVFEARLPFTRTTRWQVRWVHLRCEIDGQQTGLRLITRLDACHWAPDLGKVVIETPTWRQEAGKVAGVRRPGPMVLEDLEAQKPISEFFPPAQGSATVVRRALCSPKQPGFRHARKQLVRRGPEQARAAPIPRPDGVEPQMVAYAGRRGTSETRDHIGHAHTLAADQALPLQQALGAGRDLLLAVPLAALHEPARTFAQAIPGLSPRWPIHLVDLTNAAAGEVPVVALNPAWGGLALPVEAFGRSRYGVLAELNLGGRWAYLADVERAEGDVGPSVCLLMKADSTRLTGDDVLALFEHLARHRSWPTKQESPFDVLSAHFPHRFHSPEGGFGPALTTWLPKLLPGRLNSFR